MSNQLYQKDILTISDLNRSDLELILDTAEYLNITSRPDLLTGKIIASCFFEASTRTRLSFATAVQRLGGTLIGFSDHRNTSVTKGETLADSIKIISSYTDALVIRHPQEGAARLAAKFSNVPVINAGDGSNQHPTQTLLDLLSIRTCQGTLDNLKITFVGDLKYGRTVHSLTEALSKFGTEFHFIAPDALAMPDYLLKVLDAQDIRYHLVKTIEEIVSESDIIYMTRIQKERFDKTEYNCIAQKYILSVKSLKNAKENLKILHPLPRFNEIDTAVDSTRYAYYFQQAKNGVYARQALLALILNNNILGGSNK